MSKPVLLENNFSPLAGNYCLAIFLLTQTRGKPPIAAELATHFGVTPPTVSYTLRRLKRDGLIGSNYSYKAVRLSVQGNELALKLLQRQQLMNRFLTETLGFSREEALEEAYQLKDNISPRVEKALKNYLTGEPFTSTQTEQNMITVELNYLAAS